MSVQDDVRERELAGLFNLDWDREHQRDGTDGAVVVNVAGQKYSFDVEIKSTTSFSVATARDVGLRHIEKWRRMIFIIGFYSKGSSDPALNTCLCLLPTDMEPWILKIESKIAIDFKISELTSKKLGLEDLYEVCGKKISYSISDAKQLHKKQFSQEQYQAALDVEEDGVKKISPEKMLEILRLRSKYISERGTTLNNPHVPSALIRQYFGTSREISRKNAVLGFQELVRGFIAEHPEHPVVVLARGKER